MFQTQIGLCLEFGAPARRLGFGCVQVCVWLCSGLCLVVFSLCSVVFSLSLVVFNLCLVVCSLCLRVFGLCSVVFGL